MAKIVDQIWKIKQWQCHLVLTECSKNADPSLQNIENGILNGLKEVQYLSNEIEAPCRSYGIDFPCDGKS